MKKASRVFFWEIEVKIPSQKTHLRNLTCKIVAKFPTQEMHLGNQTCDFPEKYPPWNSQTPKMPGCFFVTSFDENNLKIKFIFKDWKTKLF